MTYYIDTSSLVKVYHVEAGTPAVLGIYSGSDEIVISELSKIECLSTIYRKYREHEITHDTLNAVVTKFEYDLQHRYKVVRFSFLVIDEAWNILRRFADSRGVRTLDSLQYAFFTTYCDQATQFVCSDAALGDLVKSEGFHLVTP
jgi:predicted nucleic acid-binding protein